MQQHTSPQPAGGTTYTNDATTTVVDGSAGARTVSRGSADGSVDLLGLSECTGARPAAAEPAQHGGSSVDFDADDSDVDERDWAPTRGSRRSLRTGGRHTRGRREIAAQHRDAGRHIARALAGR